MKTIRLVRIGSPDPPLVDAIRFPMFQELGYSARIDESPLDPSGTLHPERQQFHSSELIEKLAARKNGRELVLGVTPLDLYIPILTFVFGEAQLGGVAGVVSYHRLRQTFYGLEEELPLLTGRLLKEAIHETGHMLGLRHCDDYRCVMASAHSVELIDVKEPRFCPACRDAARLQPMRGWP
ncbi:MAG: archaemetzincin family Zn-dependent metalloprotease [Thermoanaerobaculia bacterium]